MPVTCWAVSKRQVINLRSWWISLVDSVESMMMHGLANPKFESHQVISVSCSSMYSCKMLPLRHCLKSVYYRNRLSLLLKKINQHQRYALQHEVIYCTDNSVSQQQKMYVFPLVSRFISEDVSCQKYFATHKKNKEAGPEDF